MTILNSILWERLVTGRLYHCTDEVGFNYIMPGNRVHGEVKSVPGITTGGGLSDADTIKEGWSVAGLWAIWFGWVTVSVIVSALAARR